MTEQDVGRVLFLAARAVGSILWREHAGPIMDWLEEQGRSDEASLLRSGRSILALTVEDDYAFRIGDAVTHRVRDRTIYFRVEQE